MRSHRGWWPHRWLMTIGVLLTALPAGAQTRHEQLEQEREARVQALAARPPTFLDKALALAEEKKLAQRLASDAGAYPKFGSITTGGGLAFGGGFRRAFANDGLRFDGHALFSIKGYRQGRVDIWMPRLRRQTIGVHAYGRTSHFPQEEFFGLGPGTVESSRTNFRFDEQELAAQATWQPRRWLRLAAQKAWRYPRIGRGTDRHHPSTDTRFDDRAAPGLAVGTRFAETGGLAEVSTLHAPGNPRRGSRVVGYFARFDDRRNLGFDFSRLAAQAEHYVPVFDEKRVFALRGVINHLAATTGSRVPFYYMTPIGGRDSIRAFDDLRFRDATAWLVNAEYRWEALTGVDLALFYDRGAVAPSVRAFSWRSARESYGFAVRVGTARAIAMRAEIAAGSHEGFNCYVAMGAPLRAERYLR